MNERAQNLVHAPMPVAPKTTLTTVREINLAVERNLNGRNYGVYATHILPEINKPDVLRVYRARCQGGQLQVRTEPCGWIVPLRVYCEG